MITPESLAKSGTEHGEQAALFCWAAQNHERFPQFRRCLFAVPNGGRRDKLTGVQMQAEGVKKGVSDVMLLVPRGQYHGLCLEMKRANGGVVSDYQKEFGAAVTAEGYAFCVAYGWQQAKATLEWYMAL